MLEIRGQVNLLRLEELFGSITMATRRVSLYAWGEYVGWPGCFALCRSRSQLLGSLGAFAVVFRPSNGSNTAGSVRSVPR